MLPFDTCNLGHIAGTALILVGLVYLVRQLKGSHGHVHLFGGHSHHEHGTHLHHYDSHEHYDQHDHDHDHNEERLEIETIEREWSRRRSDWAVIVGLFALLTFSPCEAFLPVFLIGSKYGWLGFAFLSAVLATATVSGMVTFTWLTLLGSQRLHFEVLDKYDAVIVGGIFCLLGVLIILFEKWATPVCRTSTTILPNTPKRRSTIAKHLQSVLR